MLLDSLAFLAKFVGMSLFDAPAIAVRKRVPEIGHSALNVVEEYTQQRMYNVAAHQKRYVLGIVLSIWAQWHGRFGTFKLSIKDMRKMQAIYESCLKILGSDAFDAFMILSDLHQQGHIPDVFPNLFPQLAENVCSR